MSKKVVFLDIDGTVYAHDIGVPESTITAIQKLLENNHIPIICTGRAKAMIPQYIIDLGFKGLIAAAGTDIYYEGNPIHQVTKGSKEASKIGNLLYEGNCDYLLEGPDHLYYDSKQISNKSNNRINRMMDKIRIDADKFKPINEGEVVYNKVSGSLTEDSLIHPDVKEEYDIIAHSEMPLFELVPKGYNKAVGVEKILDHLHIEKKDTYAFGDSNNDIEMLDYVEYGVAMGNAYTDVLARAKYKTKSIYEDGVYHGLKEFGLI